MAAPVQHEAHSLAAFAARVEQVLDEALARQVNAGYKGLWYRGVGRATVHRLEPSLFRHPSKTAIEDLIKLERLMLEDFARQDVLHGEQIRLAGDDRDFRALFFMQHYGVPTRFLDWSSNPFIALYFALTSAPRDAAANVIDDAAVWVLDPVAWNNHALADVSYGDRGPISVDSDEARSYSPRKLIRGSLEPSAIKTMYERPAATLGFANNARMFAQRGVFTLFGSDTRPMEEQYDQLNFPPETLVKIMVPRAQVHDLTVRLLQVGYTDSVAFPDLQGLAMEIKRMSGFRM